MSDGVAMRKDRRLGEVEMEDSGRPEQPPKKPTDWRLVLSKLGRLLAVWIPVGLLLAWTLVPLVISLSVSLKSRALVMADTGLIPQEVTFEAYRTVLSREGFWNALLNSVILGFTTIGFTTLLAVPAAYAFARFSFVGRSVLLLFSLIPLLVPKVALMLPLYEMGVAVGGLNTKWYLTVVFTGTLLPLATWVLVGFFQAIPRELEEAAAVDGATLYQRVRLVLLPLSLPALITVGVLAFREAWTEFELVLALTSSPAARTLPYELFLTQEIAGLPNLPAQAAFALLTVIPLLLVYSYIERYVTQGIVSGAGK